MCYLSITFRYQYDIADKTNRQLIGRQGYDSNNWFLVWKSYSCGLDLIIVSRDFWNARKCLIPLLIICIKNAMVWWSWWGECVIGYIIVWWCDVASNGVSDVKGGGGDVVMAIVVSVVKECWQ